MYRHYLTAALRNFWKNKIFSFINITGLTIGLTSCLLIAVYIQHELSYDHFETKGGRIVRVIMQYSFAGSTTTKEGNFTSVRVAAVFKKTFPEVVDAVKMFQAERIVGYGEKLFSEKNFVFADPSFFNLFSFHLLRGNPRTVLAGPHQVVLTESMARKYFGTEDPVGKILSVNGSDSSHYLVTGIIQDCPATSQIQFDFLASFSSLGITPDYAQSYWDANYTTYLLLRDKSAIRSLQAKLGPFMEKEMAGQGATVNFFLEPFEKVHLYSPYAAFEPNNSITFLYILALVALFILGIVCSTYINLSTARSMERAREVGIRKVAGAEKAQLFWQFIGESAMFSLLSLLLSLGVSVLLLPFFNHLTGIPLSAAELFSLPLIGFAVFMVVLLTFLAGSYPAVILARFQPVKVLKGSFSHSDSSRQLKKWLVIFQLAISVALILSTFMIQKQLYFIQHKNLGYDRDQVLVLPMDNQIQSRIELIKQRFKSNPHILLVSRCVSTPVNIPGGYDMRSSIMPENHLIAVTGNPIDQDYIRTAGLHLIAGEDLTKQDILDAAVDSPSRRVFHFILNESAARALGWTPAQAIGKRMFLDDWRPGFVKGVVQDFNFESLHNLIKPLVLFPSQWGRLLLVKIDNRDIPGTISFLAQEWKELAPQRPFDYHFMDEDFNQMYANDQRLGRIMNLFSAIAIALACLGLFGLASYSVSQRVIEIGIRKVLGASVGQIVLVLSADFLRPAVYSLLIGLPIAWWVMDKWLQGFAYRTSLDWRVFFIAGVITLLLALGTVSFQTIKAGRRNPVKSLKTE